MHLRLATILMAVALFGSAGCGEDEPVASTPTADDPARPGDGAVGDEFLGRVFVGSEITVDGSARPVPGGRLAIDFTEPGRVGANAGCNSMSGEMRIEGATLVVENLGSTQMGCDPTHEEMDALVAELLTARPSVEVTTEGITLRSERVSATLVDRETAEPTRPLEATVWTLDTIIDGETASTVPDTSEPLTLTLADGTFTFTLCNGISTPYALDGTTLRVEPFAMTEMSCGEELDRLESFVVAMLSGPVEASTLGDSLKLSGADGKGLGFAAGRAG